MSKCREKPIDNDGKYVLNPLEDKSVLNPHSKCVEFGAIVNGFKEV